MQGADIAGHRFEWGRRTYGVGIGNMSPVSFHGVGLHDAEVAEAAAEAGTTILNDVWSLQRSQAIADLASRRGCALVLMHNQEGTEYASDLMEEIKRVLREATRKAIDAGVSRERILVDPGIGFGKTADQNWEVMHRLEELKELGQPILIGT